MPLVRWSCRLASISALALGAYAALLFAPGPLFRYAYAATNVTIHSDRPLPSAAADVVARIADVARDRLVQASGHEAPGERTLDYYLSHEIAHRMTHLLDREQWTVPDLLRSPPNDRAVEARVRAGRIELRRQNPAR